MDNGTRGFGTGDLRSYGYQGQPPLNKGYSANNGMSSGHGPVRAMDMGYDHGGYDKGGYGGGNQYMKGGASSVGKYDQFGADFSSKESTAYTNSNYRKPFNPNNMQTPTSSATMSSGMHPSGYRNNPPQH